MLPLILCDFIGFDKSPYHLTHVASKYVVLDPIDFHCMDKNIFFCRRKSHMSLKEHEIRDLFLGELSLKAIQVDFDFIISSTVYVQEIILLISCLALTVFRSFWKPLESAPFV